MVHKPSHTTQQPPLRLWHVTATWVGRNNKRLKRDFIISAYKKDEATEMVHNRVFAPTTKSTEPDIRARDLGPVQNPRTFFSSDIIPVNVFSSDESSPIDDLILQFTLKWGAEIGWRSTNQGASEKDLIILEKLKNEKDRTTLLYEWAKEYTDHPTQDPDKFIASKMSSYLGTQVTTSLSDMIPVSDTEYSHIMKNAKQQAANIIAEAQKSADEIRTQLNTETEHLAEIAKALNKRVARGSFFEVEVPPEVEDDYDGLPAFLEDAKKTAEIVEARVRRAKATDKLQTPQEEQNAENSDEDTLNDDMIIDTIDDMLKTNTTASTSDETDDDFVEPEDTDSEFEIDFDSDWVDTAVENDENAEDDAEDDIPDEENVDTEEEPTEEILTVSDEELADIAAQIEPVETSTDETPEETSEETETLVSEPVQEVSDADLNAWFPDDDEENDDDDYGSSYEEDIPEDELLEEDETPPDFEFQIEDLDEYVDVPEMVETVEPVQQKTASKKSTKQDLPQLTDDEIAKELIHFKPEYLLKYLPKLKIQQNIKNGGQGSLSADRAFKARYPEAKNEKTKSEIIVDCISYCQAVNRKSALRWVYDKLRSEMSYDEIIE